MKVNKFVACLGVLAASLTCSVAHAGWTQTTDPNTFDSAMNPGFGAGGPSSQSPAALETWLEDLIEGQVSYVPHLGSFSAGSITGLPGTPTAGLYITLHYGSYQVSGNKENNVTVAWNCTTGCSTFTGFETKALGNYRVFEGVAAVPEPETYALMLAGLGLMGAVARRRKPKQV